MLRLQKHGDETAAEPTLPSAAWRAKPPTWRDRVALGIAGAMTLMMGWLMVRGIYLATRELWRWLL